MESHKFPWFQSTKQLFISWAVGLPLYHLHFEACLPQNYGNHGILASWMLVRYLGWWLPSDGSNVVEIPESNEGSWEDHLPMVVSSHVWWNKRVNSECLNIINPAFVGNVSTNWFLQTSCFKLPSGLDIFFARKSNYCILNVDFPSRNIPIYVGFSVAFFDDGMSQRHFCWWQFPRLQH